MKIDENWDFETAMYEINAAYRPGGKSTGQVRNNLVEAWGQLVGRTRATTEFYSAIEKYGSLSAFGRAYSVTLNTLYRFRFFFETLPDDSVGSKVFVSYAREDQGVALEIYDFLKENRCSPWMDVYDLKAGQDWKVEIDKAIQSSNFFIACLSSNSISKRGYVQKELKIGLSVLELMPEDGIYLLPIKLDECVIPHALASKHWIDWREDGAKKKILEAIGI
jgi:hypothetical protein